jgi:hypothetical protein
MLLSNCVFDYWGRYMLLAFPKVMGISSVPLRIRERERLTPHSSISTIAPQCESTGEVVTFFSFLSFHLLFFSCILHHFWKENCCSNGYGISVFREANSQLTISAFTCFFLSSQPFLFYNMKLHFLGLANSV